MAPTRTCRRKANPTSCAASRRCWRTCRRPGSIAATCASPSRRHTASCGEFAKAIEHYAFALDTGELDSKTTIKAAEQLFNLTARQAEREKDPERLRDAIARLKAMQDVGETAERFNLLRKRLQGTGECHQEAHGGAAGDCGGGQILWRVRPAEY